MLLKLWRMKTVGVGEHGFAAFQRLWGHSGTMEAVVLCSCPALTPPIPTFAAVSLAEIKRAAINTCMHAQVSVSSRFPWFLQLLHRRGVSSGSRATGDSAELCFCFWHGGQEANEEVVGHADHELHQPAGGWDTLLRPAHLDQAPRPRERAVLRPRTLQCNGQRSPVSVRCNEHPDAQTERELDYTGIRVDVKQT